jgi:hypothetical protein
MWATISPEPGAHRARPVGHAQTAGQVVVRRGAATVDQLEAVVPLGDVIEAGGIAVVGSVEPAVGQADPRVVGRRLVARPPAPWRRSQQRRPARASDRLELAVQRTPATQGRCRPGRSRREQRARTLTQL